VGACVRGRPAPILLPRLRKSKWTVHLQGIVARIHELFVTAVKRYWNLPKEAPAPPILGRQAGRVDSLRSVRDISAVRSRDVIPPAKRNTAWIDPVAVDGPHPPVKRASIPAVDAEQLWPLEAGGALRPGAEDCEKEVRMPQRYAGTVRAPRFPEGYDWFNSEPISLRSLRGKIVVLDFWTYC
jgi:hypothetical protein